MTVLVIDVSVAAKWVLPEAGETLGEEATELLRRYTRNEVGFMVPDLFWSEFGNVLWKAVRSERISENTAHEALDQMREYKLPTVSVGPLLHEALTVATTFDRSLYDSLYVTLAITSKTQLITADEKLANALASRLPVKWLGALQ